MIHLWEVVHCEILYLEDGPRGKGTAFGDGRHCLRGRKDGRQWKHNRAAASFAPPRPAELLGDVVLALRRDAPGVGLRCPLSV